MLVRAPAKRASKKAVNLSVDKAVLEQAKHLELNLSQVFEAGLTQAIRERQRNDWLKQNRAALVAYNEHIEQHGVFSDGLRSF